MLSAGSSSRTLSAYSVDLATRTFFVLTLNNSDETALNQFLNRNGNDSILNQTYNLTALAGYNGNRASTTRNSSITVAGILAPNIISSAFDYETGVLTVQATNLFVLEGVSLSLLTITVKVLIPVLVVVLID